MRWGRVVGVVVLAAVCSAGPAHAARPLLDQHQWDRYFALFARDSDVPWKNTDVRLDTYSSAPVALSAYAVMPEDVIVAGNSRGRALDVAKREPVVRWRFSPPPGYRVEGNDITVPLGKREGVFIVQARRGAAVQQVWINRSRIGLLSKEAPRGIVIYGCDLGSGKPLVHLRVLFLTDHTLVTRFTDARGLIHWDRPSRPSFVLAEWGQSRAFLSLLPQAPVPNAIAAIRVDRAVVRAGEDLNVVGYARRIRAGVYERSGGYADIRLFSGGRVLAQTRARLDDSGAFFGHIGVPSNLGGGMATVLATVAGASAGTSVTIESSGDLGLTLKSPCLNGCIGVRSVPIEVIAQRQGKPVADVGVSVAVVRYPHVVAPNKNLDASASWGATEVLHVHGRTDANGSFHVTVPEPGDGLPSTLGITAQTEGAAATAATRISVPNSRAALEIEPEREQLDVGRGIALNVHAFDAQTGAPLMGYVHLRVSHGPNAGAQTVHLNERGFAHVVFSHPQLGSNLLVANYVGAAGDAYDANSVVVAPRALTEQQTAGATAEVRTDRTRYRMPATVTVDIDAPGAHGSALLSIDALTPAQQQVVTVQGGHVHGRLKLNDAEGDVRAAVAYVHDGVMVVGSTPLTIDGPGHQRQIDLVPERLSAAGGTTVPVAVHDGNIAGSGTTVVRLTDGLPSNGALFDNAADVLASGGVTTLVSAGDDPPWHAWVTPRRSVASDFLADLGHRPIEQQAPTLDASSTRVLYWHAERNAPTIFVPLPHAPGHYILSILRMYQDGDVGGASTVLNVHD